MRLTSIINMSAILLIAAPVAAQSSSQAGSAAATAAQTQKAAEEKKVCKRLEVSGTRMTERVCLTKEEWQKVEEQK